MSSGAVGLVLARALREPSAWRRSALADDTWPAPARVVAVGDVHGDFDAFVTVLRAAGLVDDKLKWTGGGRTWCRPATAWTGAGTRARSWTS